MKFDVNEENYESLYSSWDGLNLVPTQKLMPAGTFGSKNNMLCSTIFIDDKDYNLIPADLVYVDDLNHQDIFIYLHFLGCPTGYDPACGLSNVLVTEEGSREWDETVAIHESLLKLIELGYLEEYTDVEAPQNVPRGGQECPSTPSSPTES